MNLIKNLILSFFLLICFDSIACTTAVISGKATKDGRPILWKIRDTDYLENHVKKSYNTPGKYSFIALMNSADTLGLQVWAGTNSEGFAIMNSASFNVNLEDSIDIKNQEGYFMKKALEECANLNDFEKLLDKTLKPMGLAAHFGVIDAEGACAFYEVNNYTWYKYDANDTTQAPNGYILRTNFSETGKENIGYGFVRLQTAEELFQEKYKNSKLDYQSVIQSFSRCLYNPITNNDYKNIYSEKNSSNVFIHSDNLITSHGTASCVVIQGVKPEENKEMTTMWTMVGYPNTCIAVPLWVATDVELPNIVTYDSGIKNSKLNSYNIKLFKECYPIDNPDGYHYLQISKLVNKEGTGYMQQIEAFENEIFAITEEKLTKWRNQKFSATEIEAFYKKINDMIETKYQQLIN